MESNNKFDIAIVGMAGRFPGADDIESFWRNLKEGKESITFLSDQELEEAGVSPEMFNDPEYVKACSAISDIEMFDAAFFNYSPREAQMLDPQQRVFMECAWEVMENAGYNPENCRGLVAVYAGMGISSYLLNNLYNNICHKESPDIMDFVVACDKDFMPNRVSYKFGFSGPSVSVQSACSTSLVAVHMACQSLLNGECDMALAGGVTIKVPQKVGYLYREGMILSPDGHCRSFDIEAKGMIGANGAGVVALKRFSDALEDGDCIHAVIKGSATNNDGSLKIGYTAPSVQGQAAVIEEAQYLSGVEVESISYLEAHGTATALGDQVEAAALIRAFRKNTDKKGFCALGALKSNVGHMECASGVGGLIKTALSLKHRKLVPTLHFKTPNPMLNLEKSPFYVNTEFKDWPAGDTPRRAGVSSFGIGGSNAHAILEEAPAMKPSGESRSNQLILLSARSLSALDQATSNLADYLEAAPEVNPADAAYTLSVGRKKFSYGRALVIKDNAEAVKALRDPESEKIFTAFQESEKRPLVFMFTGQGSQYVNMGLELYQTEPFFRERVDKCAEFLKPQLGFDIREELYPAKPRTAELDQQLNQSVAGQPALFILEYALASLWMKWGVKPQAMIGHSIGEYSAACLAGVISPEEALTLVTARSKLALQLPPDGGMLAVFLSAEEITPYLNDDTFLSAANGPFFSLVSGKKEAIEKLAEKLTEEAIACKALPIERAFHSPLMEPIVEELTEKVRQMDLKPPKIPYISNLTGTWITDEQATDTDYWGKHIRRTVRFDKGIRELFQNTDRIFLEVGPDHTLTSFLRMHPDKADEHLIFPSMINVPSEDYQTAEAEVLLETLGQLRINGVEPDWEAFYDGQRRHRLPLPTYPFERRRYWVDPPDRSGMSATGKLHAPEEQIAPPALHSRPNLNYKYAAPETEGERKLAEIWQKYLGIAQVGINDNFIDLGGNSLIATGINNEIKKQLDKRIPIVSFFNYPTIKKLSAFLEQDEQSFEFTPLVNVRPVGDKPPVYLFHPADGRIFCFNEIMKRLKHDRPIYGLQAFGVEDDHEPINTLEKMAEEYIKAMEPIPEESLMMGFCFGGSIAYEIARQMKKQGRKAPLTVLIDTFAPLFIQGMAEKITAEIEVGEFNMFMGFLRDFGGLNSINMIKLYYEVRGLDPEKGISVMEKDAMSVSHEERMGILVQCAQRGRVLDSDAKAEDIDGGYRLYTACTEATLTYKTIPSEDRVVLFRATDSVGGAIKDEVMRTLSDNIAKTPSLGWDACCENLEIYDVPGDHFSILRPPNVEVLMEKLNGILNK